jgi:demethylmenaquinone methyltransferase/2-methoxy-6-polyprenyl-1,4-benzoquinol methylase
MEKYYSKQDPETVKALFNQIAHRYDFVNAVLSFRMHHYWNRSLVKEVLGGKPIHDYVDLCGGTGEIAFSYLKANKAPQKTVILDFSQEMLCYAKEKAENLGLETENITYVQADAQDIPLEDQSVDAVTIAYGIRNVKDPQKCISEVARILRPGGSFGILELTRPSNPVLKWGHSFYLRYALPRIASWIAKDKEAYDYLCDTVHQFMSPDILETLMTNAGFKNIQQRPLPAGIATIIKGEV